MLAVSVDKVIANESILVIVIFLEHSEFKTKLNLLLSDLDPCQSDTDCSDGQICSDSDDISEIYIRGKTCSDPSIIHYPPTKWPLNTYGQIARPKYGTLPFALYLLILYMIDALMPFKFLISVLTFFHFL